MANASTTCQVCGAPSRVVWVKDRNVSCGDCFEGRRLFPENVGATALLECSGCGFAWFDELHGWSAARFQADIYNAEYLRCDAPFVEERPAKLAAWLAPLAVGRSVLDYGGGRGRMAELLRGRGIDAVSFDPFYGDAALPAARDMVTAFEVVEHVPDQASLFRALRSLVHDDGVILFSTLLKAARLDGDWWYASPRNGHVSFHTATSLRRTLDAAGLRALSLSDEVHVAALHTGKLAAFRGVAAVQVNDTPLFALPLQ